MSNAIATIQAAPVALVHTSPKGVQRTYNSEAAQSRAPSATRHAVADHATLRALVSGQYVPFLRDVRGACSAAHAAGLVHAVSQALATVQDGITMVPTGDVLAVSNKKTARAVAQWLQNPTTEKVVKGVTTREAKPLPKGKAYLSAIAAQWLAAMSDANMGAEQPAQEGAEQPAQEGTEQA